MNEEINLSGVLDMMIRRWWIWAVCAVVFSVIVFIYTEVFVEPMYKTDGTLYVSAQRSQSIDISSGSMLSSQELVKTYREILNRRTFLDQISEDVDKKYSAGTLRGMISYSDVNSTQIMQVTVTGAEPQDVYDTCHSVLIHAPDELIRVVNAGSVKVLDDGQIPTVPFSPDVKKNTFMAFLTGVVVGAGIILLLELFDTRIKTRDDIIKRYPEPLLGEIPEVLPVEKVGSKQ